MRDPSGVGVGYQWSLVVAGQTSAPSINTTSYAPPVVTSIVVSERGSNATDSLAVPTSGGATVTVSGQGFGDLSSRIVVTWNGVPVVGLALVQSHTTLRFPSPAGAGPVVNLVVLVAGQGTSTYDTGAALTLR